MARDEDNENMLLLEIRSWLVSSNVTPWRIFGIPHED